MRSGDDEQGSAGGTADAVALIPPRFRWLRRLVVTFGALVFCVALMRVGWGWYAQWQFDRYVAELRARGEPALPEDFATMAMPPEEENAYVLLERAMAARPELGSGELRLWCIASDPALIEEYPDYVRGLVQRYQPVVELVLQAANAKQCVPPGDLNSSLVAMRTNAQELQNLGDEMFAAALIALHDGDSSHGLRLQRAALRIGEANVFWGDEDAEREWKLGLHREEYRRFCWSVASVTVAPSDIAQAHGDVSRREVVTFVRRLLDDSDFVDSRRHSDYVHRGRLLARISSLSIGEETLLQASTRALFAPNWLLRAVRRCRQFDSERKALPEHAAAIVKAVYNRVSEVDEPEVSASDVVDGPDRDALQRQVVLRLRLVASRRMAAIALAIRMFEADEGRLPDTLDELVPAQLPSVPVDPFRSDGGPIGYFPNEAPPRLYSVGLDQEDDGASVPDWPAESSDQVVFLRRPTDVRRPEYEFTIPTPVASTPRRDPDEDAVADDRGNDDDTETEE